MTGREAEPLRHRRHVRRWALLLFLLPAVLAAAGCGRMPRIIVLTDPLTAEEHLALGVAYERNGEFDLAIREYERALRKEKDFFQARVNLGNARLAKKEYGKAEEEYRKALEVRPGDPEATNNLAWAAILTGERMEGGAGRAPERLPSRARQEAILRTTIASRPIFAHCASSVEKGITFPSCLPEWATTPSGVTPKTSR